MKPLIILCAAVALSTAAPGNYVRENYQFNDQSASFVDDELQKKNEEAGRLDRFHDLDSGSPPQRQTSYHQSQYNAPESDDTRIGVKGRPSRTQSSYHRQQASVRRDWRYDSENPDEHSNDFEGQDYGHGHNFNHREHGHRRHRLHGMDHTFESSGTSQSSSGTLYQHNHGARGRDYWMRTEGQNTGSTVPVVRTTTENIKPIYEVPEPEVVSPSSASQTVSSTSTNNDHLQDMFDQINKIAQMDELLRQQSQGRTTETNLEDVTTTDDELTQQTQQGFDLTQQIQQGFDLTQQTQDKEFNMHVSAQQRDQTQQSGRRNQQQSGFGTLEFSGQHEDLSQHHEDTQQTQDFGLEHHEDLSQHTQTGIEIGSQHRDQTQQRQTGFGRVDYTGQQDDLTQQTQTAFEDITQPSRSQTREPSQRRQSGYGTLEFTGQDQHEDLSQHTQTGFEDMTQQTQSGFEIGSQQRRPGHGRLNQQEDLTQQHEDLSQHTQTGFEDMTQQTQSGFEIGSQQRRPGYGRLNQQEDLTQQHEDISQNTQTGFEIGSQQRDQRRKPDYGRINQQEDLTQQTQTSSEDLTQQTQTGFEIGSQQRDQRRKPDYGRLHQQDLTQQTQTSFEDLTQQTQSGFEFGSQQRDQRRKPDYGTLNQQPEDLTQQHEDLTQQTQHGFEDLTQQTQTGFEIGSHHRDQSQRRQETGRLQYSGHGQQQEDLTQQHEDLTQQTQTGFGRLEFGSQNRDFSQQTQHEYGQLEFGQQHEDDLSVVGLTSQKPQGRTYSQAAQGSSSGSNSYSRSYSSQQHEQSTNSGSYSRTIQYGQPNQTPTSETTEDLQQRHEDQQVAHQVHDVTQQVQKVEPLHFAPQTEDLDFNQKSTQEILGQSHIITADEVEEISTTTEKPGFWKRVGSSITSTYENAKEKTKNLADKVKHNLG